MPNDAPRRDWQDIDTEEVTHRKPPRYSPASEAWLKRLIETRGHAGPPPTLDEIRESLKPKT